MRLLVDSVVFFFFFSSRRRHTRCSRDWSSDVCSSDLTENWANMWLNEGFAEFMPGQYWGAKLGRHAEDDYYLDEYRQYRQIDARRRMPLAALGSNNIYPKGALVLRMLLRYLGPERFWASINVYLRRHALANATTDRSEEHTSELQSRLHLVCRLLLEKKKKSTH